MNGKRRLAKTATAIVCLSTMSFAKPLFAVTVASDNASDLSISMAGKSATTEGLDFGPWNLAFSGDGIDLFHDPQFIDNGHWPETHWVRQHSH